MNQDKAILHTERLDPSFDAMTAIVTGARGHLGSAIVKELLFRGANVVAADKIPTDLSVIHPNLTQIEVDAETSESSLVIVECALERFGTLDILVNNAALVGDAEIANYAAPLEFQSLETWRRALEVNLTFPFSLAKDSSKYLSISGNGAIVNIGSIYASVGPDPWLYQGTEISNPTAYGASKGGLLQLTRYLASALAPQIRVNMVSPGGIHRQQSPDFVRNYIERTPLRRMGRESDVVPLIIFLLSQSSSYITGQNFIVDGGYTCL